MKKHRLLEFLLILVLSWGISLGLAPYLTPHTAYAQSTNLTVSAALSLKNALEELKPIYQKSQPNVKITYNFGSSGSLQQQIEQGAPVDLFISAGVKQMDALESKKLLVIDTRRNLLSNSIVLITPKNQQIVKEFTDLTRPEIKKIAIGEPKTVPAGQYGAEVLQYYKLLEPLKSRLIYGKDVRQVLTYVETSNVEAGLVFTTDARISNKVRIAATAPSQSHQPIVYPGAVIKDSKKIPAAKAFLQFLTSQPAKTVFTKYGFKV